MLAGKTVNWNFGRKSGAPVVYYQGSAGCFADSTGEYFLTVDATKSGAKLDNQQMPGNTSTQINVGTKLTIPVLNGTVIKTKIDGAGYSINGVVQDSVTDVTYTYEGETGTIDIISNGRYIYYLTVEYPNN